MSNYILEGKHPKKVDDLLEWAKWFEKGDRVVAKTKIGEAEISTVFLGIDHSFSGRTPLLFETMIFWENKDEYQVRAVTWNEAVKNHEFAIAFVKQKQNG